MSKEADMFDSTVKSLFNGMDAFLSTKTVVGEQIVVGDTVIIPLVDVSFGVGAGALSSEKNAGAGGMGGKMIPSAVIVIKDGNTRLVNISTHSGFDKLLEMVPEFVDKIKSRKSGSGIDADEATKEAAREAMEETINDAADVEKEIKE